MASGGNNIVLQVLERIRDDITEIKGDVKSVWDETKKTNGRVNGHDVDLARIDEKLENLGAGDRKMWTVVGWVVSFASGVGTAVLSFILR